MENYLTHDITKNILEHLNKNDSFNLTNIAKFMNPVKKELYGKYVFNTHKIQNNDIMKHIKHIKCDSLPNFSNYNNLASLSIIYDDYFDESLDNLPETLQYLEIESGEFNRPIDYLPKNLKSLKFGCYNFNQPLNNLPPKLEILDLENCEVFSHQLTNLPGTLTLLNLCYSYNFSLDNIYSMVPNIVIKN
jgi:hypothetical protein